MRRKVRQVSIYRLNDVSRRPARQAPFDRVLSPLPRIKLQQKLKEKARIHALSIQFDLGDGSIKKIECGAQVWLAFERCRISPLFEGFFQPFDAQFETRDDQYILASEVIGDQHIV